MNNATLVESLRPLPRVSRVRLGAQIERLHRICEGSQGAGAPQAPQSLEPFLEQVLGVLGEIFGGSAGAFWFPARGAPPLSGAAGKSRRIAPSVRSGFVDLPVPAGAVAALDAAVATHWQSPEPVVQELAEWGVTLLVGPLRDGREGIGAVQLIILDADPSQGRSSERAPTTASRAQLYRRALAGTLAIIQPALLRRLQVRTISWQHANQGMSLLGQQIAGIQRSIRLAIEGYLQQLSGATCDSFQENQQFVRSMQQLLDGHGLRVRCPECGHPAILRCSRNASVASGVFVFDHYLPQGRTFHGGSRTLPTLRITTKPARRKPLKEPTS